MRLPREALQAADRASALSPTDTQTLNTLGIVYTQANAHERAMALSQRAVALMPDRASHRFNLATLLTFAGDLRSEEHTSELQSLMRISYAVFCLKKKKHKNTTTKNS